MIKKISIVIIILLMNISLCAFAYEPTYNFDEVDSISKKIQQQEDYMPDVSFSKIIEDYKKSGSINGTIKEFFNSLAKFFFSEVFQNSRLMVELLFLAILSAVLENIQKSFTDNNVSKIAYYSCFIVIALIIIKSFNNAMSIGKNTINNMMDFINAIIPLLLALLASSGGITSSLVLDPVIMMVMKVVSEIIRDLVLPVTLLIVILNIVNSMSDSIKITKLISLIKQINTWILGIIVTVFTAFITIRSTTAVTLDQVTLKSTKFAVDNFIPVVGKCLSDAISTVASYSMILKDAVSVAGLVVLIVICIFPLIKIIILSLIYKFIGAVIEPVADKKIVECLSMTGSSLTTVFACVLSVCIMFFIMIAIISSTGRALVGR